MDSLVDMDILALAAQDGGTNTNGGAEPSTTHETDADLELYRIELNELQSEVGKLKREQDTLQRDVDLCLAFTEKVNIFTRTVVPPPPPPKTKMGGSKWGLLKSSILAKPEDISVAPSASTATVHLPVQPDYAKFFYLAEKLEMARRTSKFIGIRAKAPRAEYVEKSAALRELVLNAAKERSTALAEDTTIVRNIVAHAAVSTLSILEHQHPDDVLSDQPFEVALTAASAAPAPTGRRFSQSSHVPPPPRPPGPPQPSTLPAPKQQRGSVTFAPGAGLHSMVPQPPPQPPQPQRAAQAGPPPPPPPPSAQAPAVEQRPASLDKDDGSEAKRGSVLHSFRSRSNSAAVTGKAQLNRALDPQLAAFEQRAVQVVGSLVRPAEVQLRPKDPSGRGVDGSEQEVDLDLRLRRERAEAEGEFQEVLQAHCAESLAAFQEDMDSRMQVCVDHCQRALRRRTGTLAEMKGDEVFAAQIAEVLERVQELRQQLQSFVRHQQALREGTRGEHSEMVQEASTTVVQQRVAFLTRMKEKLTAVHQRNQQKLKEGRKQALVGNATRVTEGSELFTELTRR